MGYVLVSSIPDFRPFFKPVGDFLHLLLASVWKGESKTRPPDGTLLSWAERAFQGWKSSGCGCSWRAFPQQRQIPS